MNYELTKALTKFENVRAINLNYMNFSHPNLVFKFDCWPQLESLTVDFYDLVNSNDLLVKFLNGPYIRNLRSLRIMSIAISRNSILKLCENCKNLQRLQFVDVTFKVCILHFFFIELILSSRASITFSSACYF